MRGGGHHCHQSHAKAKRQELQMENKKKRSCVIAHRLFFVGQCYLMVIELVQLVRPLLVNPKHFFGGKGRATAHKRKNSFISPPFGLAEQGLLVMSQRSCNENAGNVHGG